MPFRPAVVALLLLLLAAAPARATVTRTAITTPSANPFFSLYDTDVPETGTIPLAGTSDGSPGDLVDILCFTGSSSTQLKGDVPVVAGGGFSTTFNAPAGTACRRLVAMPDNTADPLATTFTGPAAAFSLLAPIANSNPPQSVYDYTALQTTLTTENILKSAEACALQVAQTTEGAITSVSPVTCGVSVPAYTPVNGGGAGFKVGAHNAYGPSTAYSIDAAAPGLPALSVQRAFDPATGGLRVTETNPLAFCAKTNGTIVDRTDAVPTASDCDKFVPSGLSLTRVLSQSADGRVITFRDAYASTDGAAHPLAVTYTSSINSAFVRLPGEEAATVHAPGTAELGGRSVGSAVARLNPSVPTGPISPAGALTFLSAPSRAVFASSSTLGFIYERQVPAAGSIEIAHLVSSATSDTRMQALVESAEDPTGVPVVAITAPAANTTVATDAVSVTGTTSDNVRVTSLAVNGIPTTVNPDGTWSQRISLTPGANAITAIAKDGAGGQAQAEVSVVYAPPAAPATPRCVVPQVVGQTAAAAGAALTAAGCTAGNVVTAAAAAPKGTVARQNRTAGATLPALFPIDLTLSAGPVRPASLKTTSVKVKKGKATLKLACPGDAPATCAGTLKLGSFGAKAYAVPAGRTASVGVTLSRAARRKVRGRAVKTTVSLVYRDEAGKLKTVKKAVGLRG